jgi:hypothetical protein
MCLMMAMLFVNSQVASLQCDLTTTGEHVTSLVSNKSASINRLPNGKLRVVVFGLNQDVFSGRFAEVDADVQLVENVVASSPDGQPVAVTIQTVNSPKNLGVSSGR